MLMMYGLGLVNVNNLAKQPFPPPKTNSNAIDQTAERITRRLSTKYLEDIFKNRGYNCINLNSYRRQVFEISQNASTCCQDKAQKNLSNYSRRVVEICEADIEGPLNITRPDNSYYDLYLRGKNFKILNSETGEILLSADHNMLNVSIKLANDYGGLHFSKTDTHFTAKLDGTCNDEEILEIKNNFVSIPPTDSDSEIGFNLIITPKDSTGKIFDEFTFHHPFTVEGEDLSIKVENLGKNITNADHLYDECPLLPPPPGAPPAQPPGGPPFSPPPPPGAPPAQPPGGPPFSPPPPPTVPPYSPTPPPGGPPFSPPPPPTVPPSSPTPPPGGPPFSPPPPPGAPPETPQAAHPSSPTPPPEGPPSSSQSKEDSTELPLIALIAIAIPLAIAIRLAYAYRKARSNAISVRPMPLSDMFQLGPLVSETAAISNPTPAQEPVTATISRTSTSISNPPQAQEAVSLATSGPASTPTSNPPQAQEQEIKPTSIATSGPASTSEPSVLYDNNIIILNGGKRK